MSATSRRMSSTGRRARPTTYQAVRPTCTIAACSPAADRTGGSEPSDTSSATSWDRRRAASSTLLTSVWRRTTTVRKPPTTRAAATMMVAAAVVFARIVERRAPSRLALSAIGIEPVAGAAQGLDGVAAERGVDLLAEVPDVDLHDVVVAVEGVVPHVLDDVRLRHDLARPVHQVLEQRELPGRELDFDVAPPAPVRRRVEAEVAGPEHGRTFPPAPADEGPEVGDQHHEREGFGEEIVGARVESLGVVEVAVFGREHQDRRPDAGLAQLGTHLVAVAAREHDV